MALEADKVRYIGDEVAAVAAIDEETVDEALRLIDVKYEILPGVFEIEEAIKPGAPAIHEALNNIALILPVNFGNPERLMKEADSMCAKINSGVPWPIHRPWSRMFVWGNGRRSLTRSPYGLHPRRRLKSAKR